MTFSNSLTKLKLVLLAMTNIRYSYLWPKILMDYFKFYNNREMIYSVDGIKYKVRGGNRDFLTISEIFMLNLYSKKGFKIKERDVIVDIGSQIGVFTMLASKKASKGKVYGFEPIKDNFRLLKENVKLNGAKNIKLSNLAVTDKKGKREIFVSENNAMHSFFEGFRGISKTFVKTTSLKNIVRENKIKKIDYLKMDCEGSEYDIIMNTPDNVLKIIKKIAMEYHNLDSKRNGYVIKKFLENKGFNVKCKKLYNDTGMIYAKRN